MEDAIGSERFKALAKWSTLKGELVAARDTVLKEAIGIGALGVTFVDGYVEQIDRDEGWNYSPTERTVRAAVRATLQTAGAGIGGLLGSGACVGGGVLYVACLAGAGIAGEQVGGIVADIPLAHTRSFRTVTFQ